MFAKKGLKKIVVRIHAAYISINTYVGCKAGEIYGQILNQLVAISNETTYFNTATVISIHYYLFDFISDFYPVFHD